MCNCSVQKERVSSATSNRNSLENGSKKASQSSIQKTEKRSSKKGAMHYTLLEKAGPKWYQEMSPKQIEAVDELKMCLQKDLENHTVANTAEILGKLGIYPRPTCKLIRLALKECCKCPVEFLLVLYQLLNPKRSTYSINDRLLLSAVVHYTMHRTLHELHVRIPSPPRGTTAVKKTMTPIRKDCYESPYLVPFTFKPEPRKHSGIYRRPFIQHPESPYFLNKKQPQYDITQNPPLYTPENPEDPIQEEISQELTEAQTEYENLVNFKPVPILLRPSVYIQCQNIRTLNEPKEPETPVQDSQSVPTNDSESSTMSQTEPQAEEPPKLQEPCSCRIAKPQACRLATIKEENENQSECKISNMRGQCTPRIKRNVRVPKCDCLRKSDWKGNKKPCTTKDEESTADLMPKVPPGRIKYGIVGVKATPQGNVFILSGALPIKDCACVDVYRKYEKKHTDCMKYYAEYAKQQLENTNNYSVDEDLCSKGNEPGQEPGCFSPSRNNNSPRDNCTRYEEEKRYKSNMTSTRRASSASRGRNDWCSEVTNSRCASSNPNIVQSTGNCCQCLKQGTIQPNISRCCCQKNKQKEPGDFIPRRDQCLSAEMFCSPDKEKVVHKEPLPPRIPPGRIKYVISGVKQMGDQNVFILSGALPIDDCDCMKIYEQYEEQHRSCMECYEEYLRQMKEQMNTFVTEMNGETKEIRQYNEDMSGENESINVFEQNLQAIEEESKRIRGGTCEYNARSIEYAGEVDMRQSSQVCYWSKTNSMEVKRNNDNCGRIEGNKQPSTDSTCCCQTLECHCQTPTFPQATCTNQNSTRAICEICKCEIETPPEDTPPEIDPLPEKEFLPKIETRIAKRIFIKKKIPCSPRTQMKILKEALLSMAKDGFPLPKLPECHKLPHFKLWIQMRCGKFWTQDDILPYLTRSKCMWRHTYCCERRVRTPNLPITKEEEALLTWRQAEPSIKMVTDIKYKYYRKVRQNAIHFGREYFPTTFAYEFPFRTFRDCYFAYTPMKEEDVIAVRVWQSHEIKDFSKRRSCL